MYAILLPLNFLCIWGGGAILASRAVSDKSRFSPPEFRESLIYAGILFCAEVLFFTEVLSFFHILTAPCLAGAYLVSTMVAGLGLVYRRRELFSALHTWIRTPSDPVIRRAVMAVFCFIVLPYVFLAVYEPPQHLDSLTYHLPRVQQWATHGNIEAYPCDEPRQISFPPLGDVFFLHWILLAGNDYFVNTVQIGMLIGIFVLASLLAHIFGFDSKVQLLSALFILFIPTLLSEAWQPMTDGSATFFYLTFLYFGLKSIRQPENVSWKSVKHTVFFMGLSLFLGINTKMTVAIFAIPFCAWFGLRYLVLYRFKTATLCLMLVFFFLVIDGPYFAKTYLLCGKLGGDDRLQKMVYNVDYGLKTTTSNFLRLFGFQLMTPWPSVNDVNVRVMRGVHDLLGMEWNDPKTTFIPWPTKHYEYHETVFWGSAKLRNSMAVFLLLICVSASLCYSIFSSRNRTEEDRFRPPGELAIYVVLIFIGFLIFAALVRWGLFAGRLTMPGLAAFSPFCAFTVTRLFRGRWTGFLAAFAILAGVFFTAQMLYDALAFSPRAVLVEEFDPPTAATIDSLQDTLERHGCKGRLRFEWNFRPAPMGKFVWLPEKLAELENPSLSFTERYRRLREIKYFTEFKLYYVDYCLFVTQMERLEARNVGYCVTPCLGTVEYPLVLHFKRKNVDIGIHWLHYPEYYKNAPNYREDFVPDVIIFDDFDRIPDIVEKYELGDIHTNFLYYHLAEVRGKQNVPPTPTDDRPEHAE